MDDLSNMRYAHCEGHTDVCYDDSGRYLVTGGTDGDIRVWDGFEDDDPQSHHMGEVVSSVAFKDGKIYLSSDTNTVLAYTFPDVSCDGTLLQFNASVYHITCSNDGKYIAAGGGDFNIKVYNNSSKALTVFRGHDAPILGLSIDPTNKYMASSSCDGTVRIWQMSDQSCIKTWKLLKKCNDLCASNTLCRIQWHPKNGKFLVVPVEKELKFFERESWECRRTLTDTNIEKPLSICAFSLCGSYIAASSIDGQVLVWDMKNEKCIFRKPHEKSFKICSLVWNPSGKKELAFCDIEGQLGVYDDVLDSDPEKKSQTKQNTKTSDHLDDSDNSDNEVELDAACELLDEIADSDSNDVKITSKNKKRLDVDSDDDDNENAFDIGAIKAKLEPKIFGTDEDDDNLSVKSATTAEVKPAPVPAAAPATPLQCSFQPSSTPLHLDHRFMLWNSVGIIRCYNTDEENSIDVEFHNASVYHPIHLNNMRGFTMAALSYDALLLAAPKADEIPSKLECLHFGTWDSVKEWTVDMAEDEDIEAVCLGDGWAAVATDKRLIRLFTISGVQCEVFCIPGPVVSLAGIEDKLTIAYHKGAGIPGEQSMSLMLVKVNLRQQSSAKEFSLPLSSKAFLTWFGFTDQGQPCVVDTAGLIRLLNTSCSSKWIPIADTKSNMKNKSDNYFVVGVSEIQQEIRCILCKGSRYPPLLPTPIVSVLPFNLLYCELNTDKGRLEEEQGRYALLHNRIKSLVKNGHDFQSELNNVERKWTDILLKMFALATRTEHEYRAMDVAELMPNHRIVQGAIKYATQRHRIALAERLGEIVYKKITEETALLEKEAVEEEEEEDDDEDDYAPVKTLSQNSRMNSNDDDVEVIQPKPLSSERRSLPVEERNHVQNNEKLLSADGIVEMNSDGTCFYRNVTPGSSKNSPQVNPFKVQAKEKLNAGSVIKSAGVDTMLVESTRRLSHKAVASTASSGKKVSRQAKLFPTKQKKETQKEKTKVSQTKQTDKNEEKENSESLTPKKIGFPLFLQENEEKLKLENPDMSVPDIIKLATKLYKSLPQEEKQIYQQGTSKLKIQDATSNKRKHDSEDESLETSQVKQSKTVKGSEKVSGVTMNMLSQFGFKKTED